MSDHGFDWQGTPQTPQAAAPAPPAPRRGRRAAWLAAVAVVAAGGAGAAVVLSSAGAPVLPDNAVARAASLTSAAPGYRFSMDVTVQAAGQSVSLHAAGAATVQPQQTMSMTMTVAGQPVQVVTSPPWEYVEIDGNWFKLDTDSFQQAIGSGGVSPTNSDPSQLLRFLRATGTVTTVGAERIGGVPTTHYHALTQLSLYAQTVPSSERQAAASAISALEQQSGITTLPIDAWVDGRGRLRQITVSMTGVCPQTVDAGATITLDFFDYGPQPAPSIPGDATDITSAAKAGAAQQTQPSGQSGCG